MLGDETEKFLNLNNIPESLKEKYKQLILNLSDFIEHNEV